MVSHDHDCSLKNSRIKLCLTLWGSALCWIGENWKWSAWARQRVGSSVPCCLRLSLLRQILRQLSPARPWHCSPNNSQGIDSAVRAVVPKCSSFPEWGKLQPFLSGCNPHTNSVAASGHRLLVPHELPAWVSARGGQCRLAAPADTSKSVRLSAVWPVRCLGITCRKTPYL